MKSVEEVRADYWRLKRARDAGSSDEVAAVVAAYASASSRISRLWERLLGRPSIERLLYASCEERDVAVAVDLVRRGARQYVYFARGYPSAFDLAANRGDEAMCMALLQVGQPYGGSAGLSSAVWANQLAIVRLLLEHGADPQVVLAPHGGGFLFRVRGDVLRALVAAGGPPPPCITTMLENRTALGD